MKTSTDTLPLLVEGQPRDAGSFWAASNERACQAPHSRGIEGRGVSLPQRNLCLIRGAGPTTSCQGPSAQPTWLLLLWAGAAPKGLTLIPLDFLG